MTLTNVKRNNFQSLTCRQCLFFILIVKELFVAPKNVAKKGWLLPDSKVALNYLFPLPLSLNSRFLRDEIEVNSR